MLEDTNAGGNPICKILPSTIENFFNEHCIQSEGETTNVEFKVTFNYGFLAPPGYGEEDEAPSPETGNLKYMAESLEYRHLLKHPVITSFLALKWKKISLLYNLNIGCFALLVAVLSTYIFTNYAGNSLNVTAPSCSPGADDEVQLLCGPRPSACGD